MQTNLAMLSTNFIGRKEYIEKMDDLLNKQDVIVLFRNVGIGKAQILLKLKYIKEKNRKVIGGF